MPIRTVPLDIVGANGFGRYPKISSERTWNMMISDNALVPLPGYTARSVLANSGQARAIYTSPAYDHMIVVVDDMVFAVASDLSQSQVGQLHTSQGRVFISENNAQQIAIVDGLNIYVFNYGNNSFTVVLNATLGFNPTYITFQDGYLICAAGGTNRWRLSGPNDATDWPAGGPNVGLYQTAAGDLVEAVITVDRPLFVIGQRAAEVWFDTGTQLFPYQRSNQMSIAYGTLSVDTVASGYSLLVWLGTNENAGPAILVSKGGLPQQISDEGMTYVLDHLTHPEDSFGFLFKMDGHIMYMLTFRTDNLSFVYDFTVNKFFSMSDHNLDHFIAKKVTYFNGKYYFISFEDAKLYELNSQIYNYDGKEIPRIRIGKNVRLPNASRFIMSNANITIEQGVDTTIQRVELSVSRNGGESWGYTASKDLNSLGNRPNRLNFWQLGAANDAVLQWRFWSQGRFVIIGGELQVQ